MGISPEDQKPRDTCEPMQEAGALRYVVRLAPPYHKRILIVKFYEDGREQDWVLSVFGPSLV